MLRKLRIYQDFLRTYSLHTTSLRSELPYTKYPLDVPVIKKGWEKLALNSDWKPWVQTVSKICRVAIAALLFPVWAPVWAYSLTYCNLHAYRNNRQSRVQNKQKLQQEETKALEEKKLKEAHRSLVMKRVVVGAVAGLTLAAATGLIFHNVKNGNLTHLWGQVKGFYNGTKASAILGTVKASASSLPSKLSSIATKARTLFAKVHFRQVSLPKCPSILPSLKTNISELFGKIVQRLKPSVVSTAAKNATAAVGIVQEESATKQAQHFLAAASVVSPKQPFCLPTDRPQVCLPLVNGNYLDYL
jgi:hypothetical protein